MIRALLFLHITGIALWLGSLVTLYILNRRRFAADNPEAIAVVYETTRSVVRGVINPSSLIVLLSGISMMMQLGMVGQPKLFWLAFMEQFGGMVALISLALLTWQMRKVDRASSEERVARLRRLNHTFLGVGAGVTATILVVALRL